MKLLLVAAIIHGWTPLADAAVVAQAYQYPAALPLRMRNPQMAIRRHVRRVSDGRRTLHRTIHSPTTLPVAPTAMGNPESQYGKVMNENLGYSSQSDSSPSIRSRELMPFIDGSASDDLLVSGDTDTTSSALSLAVLELQSMSVIDASMSMRVNDASSNDTNFPEGPSIELLQITPLQDSSGTIMSFDNSELNFDLSMPIESYALSLSQKLTDSTMSMKINKSMSMQDLNDMSVSIEISDIALELSMPAESSLLSLEQKLIGSSMSMRFDDTFSFPIGASFVPPGSNHLSMSMHVQDSSEMSIPMEISGMRLSMELIETWSPSYSPTRGLELSLPLVLNDSTISSELGYLSMSMEITEMLHPTLGELSTQIDILDTLLPSNSPTQILELSTPSHELSMSLHLDDLSMSMEMTEKATPSNSPTLIVDLMDMDLNQFSMSLELNDLSMSMEIAETPPPSQTPSTHEPTAAEATDEVSPTQHPQVYPHPGKFVVEAEARIDLIGMYSLMEDEATAIFEHSCGSFFGDMFVGARPLLYDVQCDVIDQMLLSERRLGPYFTRGAHRNLEEASSLLVDLIVVGNSTKASDAVLADLVDEIFSVHSMAFVVQLKKDANEAGINDFERLTSINYIGGDDSTRVIESASESDMESNDNGMKGEIIAISSMLGCGVLILGMLLSYHVIKRKRASSMLREEDKENQRERVEPMSPNLGSFYQDLSPRNLQEATPKNEQLTYMYSLDDGLATPTSIASLAADSILSAADKMGQLVTEWTDNRIRLDIIAPPGKLGIIIDTCSEGPIVHSVKPNSPLDGLIFKGDLVIAVDDEDTREWSAHYLTKLMVSTLTLIFSPFIALSLSHARVTWKTGQEKQV